MKPDWYKKRPLNLNEEIAYAADRVNNEIRQLIYARQLLPFHAGRDEVAAASRTSRTRRQSIAGL
jgi:hypothetical protein